MATIARLFGMQPPELDTCRVLELGCGTGGNLTPMAQTMPNASFLGIDLSERQINDGKKLIETVGLTNIELSQASILDVDASAGEFDFIICHGVYSWVPPDVQEQILKTCHDNLAPNGIAYVSYNTYPGWHMRQTVREMMTYHAAGFEESSERITQARALLNFLIGASQASNSAYEMMLHEELEILQSSHDSYLFHEHLEPDNAPVYFHEFMERAEGAGLRFLGEAHFSAMVPTGFNDETRETLQEVAPDIVHMEQYMDFLRNRMFRQTLLCQQDIALSREIGPDRLSGLFVSSTLAPVSADGEEATEDVFQHSAGMNVTVSDPVHSAALKHLNRIWPTAMSFENLVSLASLHAGEESNEGNSTQFERLADLILNCYSSGLLEVHCSPFPMTITVDDSPYTTPLARIQASQGATVTNLLHEAVELRRLEQSLLPYLDGQHDRQTLEARLMQLVSSGELRLELNSEVITESDQLGQLIPDIVEQALDNLARQAFFVSVHRTIAE